MPEYANRYQQLRERYIASLPEKWQLIDDCWRAIQINPNDVEPYKQLRQHAHRLSGSGAGYGFLEISKFAHSVDQQISSWQLENLKFVELTDALFSELEENVKQLSSALNYAKTTDNSGIAEHAPVISSMGKSVPSRRWRLALLEDDKEQAHSLIEALENHDFETLHVTHSSDFWILLATEKVDLVILDYWLAGETALDVVAKMKRESGFTHLPVICLTAETNPTILRATQIAGCVLALNKKISTDELAEKLRGCITTDQASKTTQTML